MEAECRACRYESRNFPLYAEQAILSQRGGIQEPIRA